LFTPVNKRKAGSRPAYSAPVSQLVQEQLAKHDCYDRDSTISASDVEEALTDEDIPASQASSLATSMLRRYPGSSQEEVPVPASIGKSSTLLQSKLFGQVKKAVPGHSGEHIKRKASFEQEIGAAKKARADNGVGLGIDAWGSLRR
jgi:hypothetical protein